MYGLPELVFFLKKKRRKKKKMYTMKTRNIRFLMVIV